MNETFSLTLPSEIKSELEDAALNEGVSLDDFVVAAVREYLLIRQFRSLHKQMIIKAQVQGIETDQDVFNRIS